jgi:hypothetical protein
MSGRLVAPRLEIMEWGQRSRRDRGGRASEARPGREAHTVALASISYHHSLPFVPTFSAPLYPKSNRAQPPVPSTTTQTYSKAWRFTASTTQINTSHLSKGSHDDWSAMITSPQKSNPFSPLVASYLYTRTKTAYIPTRPHQHWRSSLPHHRLLPFHRLSR